jgi:hypothetical protein
MRNISISVMLKGVPAAKQREDHTALFAVEAKPEPGRFYVIVLWACCADLAGVSQAIPDPLPLGRVFLPKSGAVGRCERRRT